LGWLTKKEYRTKRTDIDNLLESIEKDSYDLESKDFQKQREMDKFQKTQEAMGTNMAVVMFMGWLIYLKVPDKFVKD